MTEADQRVKWDHRARPEPGYQHGVAQLDPHGTELQCNAMYFRSPVDALAWANFHGWKTFVTKTAVLPQVV